MIRIVLENELRLPLAPSRAAIGWQLAQQVTEDGAVVCSSAMLAGHARRCGRRGYDRIDLLTPSARATSIHDAIDLLAFFADRLKVYLRDQGARHDLIDAVFALPGQDDLLMIVRRVEALGRFLDTDDGANLLALVRRAPTSSRSRRRRTSAPSTASLRPKLLKEKEEKALGAAVKTASTEVRAALASEDFEAAMTALAKLRAPVDAFFDKVTVNADDPALPRQPAAAARATCATPCIRSPISRVSG